MVILLLVSEIEGWRNSLGIHDFVTNFIIMLVSASENVCPTPGCFTVLTDTA
jgi:hypothetical protein